MKKNKLLRLFASISLLVATVSSSVSLAWFKTSATISGNSGSANALPITGTSLSSYFAYGTGTQNDPYGIRLPRHLYNLAWLQYIGRFEDKQTYFEIASDVTNLNMNGWILPPIGTETNPFVGNFNGKGKTITNLTVTNDSSVLLGTNMHPSIVEDSFVAPKIVGLFGVVGNLGGAYTGSYTSSTNTIYNLGINNITVKSATSETLVGIAAGYVDATLSNVAVNNSSLYTTSSATALTSFTQNVSDYSLVGYCTKKYVNKLRLRSEDADIPTIENPNTDMGDDWGGSVNMLDMFEYLRGLANTATPYEFATAETVHNYADGTSQTSATQTETNNAYMNAFGGEYYRYENNTVLANNNEYASVTFARSSGYENFSSYNDNDDKYICLYGGVKNKRGTTTSGIRTYDADKTVTTITETNNTSDNGLITDDNDNYLCVTVTSSIFSTRINITNVKSHTTGCYFTLNSNGNLFTTIGSTSYYLYYSDSTTVSAAESPSNTNLNSAAYKWSYDSTNHRLSVNGGNYFLYFDGSTWRLFSSTVTLQPYSFSYNGQYLNASGNSISLGSGDNTDWYIEDNNVYTLIDGTKQYICYSGTNVIISPDGNKLTLYSSGSNYKFYYTRRGGFLNLQTYYCPVQVSGSSLVVDSGSSATSASSMGGTSFTRATKPLINFHDLYNTYFTKDYILTNTSTSTEDATYDTKPTYFPLTREKDQNGAYTNSGKPDQKNTGYVVSGANLSDNVQGPYGDIRVSRFDVSDISVSLSGNTTYDSNKLEIVTRTCVRGEDNNGSITYTDSKWTRISDENNSSNTIDNDLSTQFPAKKNYKTDLKLLKYKTSRTQLGNTLSSGNGHIYGLHFMDAQISKSRLVTIPNAVVLDGKTTNNGDDVASEYTNYQLPQDSIDFNLKDQGFINFFGGTYFTNSSGSNDTFFSLHTITRNENNQITDINEIKKIYAPASGEPSETNPYIYSYNGNKPTGSGPLVFDTDWITNPTMVLNAVYYFEIPVNAGEYALGSVSGKNGAYLMYLDIGAGNANFRDVTITEHIETENEGTSYPLGIEFYDFSQGSSWSGLNGGATAGVQIANDTNANQNLLYSYTNSALTVTATTGDSASPPSPPISTTYKAANVGVKKKLGTNGTASDLDYSTSESYNIVTDAITTESYNAFTFAVTRTIEETYTITGCEIGMSILLSLPRTASGFTASSTTFTVDSTLSTGTADVSSSGLVSVTGAGTIVVKMTYSEIKRNVEEWATASAITSDDTTGTIFKYHLVDYDDPNIVTRYVYDGINHVYTLYITANTSTSLVIDTLPPAGYTIVVVINDDEANKKTITSTTSKETPIPITVANNNS